MGTTADKLQNILNAKEAIRAKFGLSKELPFSQYAHNMIPGIIPEPDNPDDPDVPSGVNTDFFLCKSFQYEQSYPEYFDLKLGIYRQLNDGSGSGTEIQLDLLQTSPYSIELNRMWANGEYQISYNFSRKLWILRNKEGIVAESSELFEGWPRATYDSDITVDVKKSTVYPAYEGIRTWTGAKVVLTDDGYAVDEASTATMMSFKESRIAQVGHIYNSDATIEAAWLYKNLEPHGKYICSYVNRNYLSYDKIVVSGMPENAFVGGRYFDDTNSTYVDLPADIAARNPNGVYTLQNPDATYISQMIWLADNGCILKGHSWEPGFQIVPGEYSDYSGAYIQYTSYNGVEYPSNGYESYVWTWYNGTSWVEVPEGKVAPEEPAPVEQYWEGYKLYQDKTGKWNYESETTRLTYGDYMPVQGRIYDAMPTMEISDVEFSEEALWSCPRNMTSDENEEWVISASGYYGDRYPWQAFDNDMHKIWNGISTDTGDWLQWQNKKRKVLIKELCIYCDDYMQWNTNCFLQGSDDGVTWTDLRRGIFAGQVVGDSVYEGEFVKVVVKLPNNGTAYHYHRFGHASYGTNGWVRHVVARPQFERTVPETAPKVSDRNEV